MEILVLSERSYIWTQEKSNPWPNFNYTLDRVVKILGATYNLYRGKGVFKELVQEEYSLEDILIIFNCVPKTVKTKPDSSKAKKVVGVEATKVLKALMLENGWAMLDTGTINVRDSVDWSFDVDTEVDAGYGLGHIRAVYNEDVWPFDSYKGRKIISIEVEKGQSQREREPYTSASTSRQGHLLAKYYLE
jgi:hypothetical protein